MQKKNNEFNGNLNIFSFASDNKREKSDSIPENEQKSLQQRSKHRRKGYKTRKMPVALLIAMDIMLAGLLLFVLYQINYSLPADLSKNAIKLPVPAMITNTADIKHEVNNQNITRSKQSIQGWGTKFADKFTNGEVQKSANSYKSANMNATISKISKDGVTYYVTDIYLKNLKYFKTAFAKGKYGRGIEESTDTIANANKAVIAVNGDFCSMNAGPVVRNGVLYRDEKYKDVLVLNYDGSMETFTSVDFDMAKVKKFGAYQVWTFGPMLLQNGKPMEKFDSTLNPPNPRTAIGYYEPGHYCFVVVDGRQPGYSNGYTLKEMSNLFYNLGCKVAFNLDGGQSSEMVFMGKLVNKPYNGGRGTSDIVYISDD